MNAGGKKSEHPQRGSATRRFAKRLANLETAKFIALILAGTYAVFELSLTRIDRHVDTAMSLVQEFSQGQLGENRRFLNDRWYTHWDDVRLLQEAGYGATSAPIQAFIRNTIVGELGQAGQKEVRLAIAELTDSLDRLAICAKPPFNRDMFNMFAQCDPKTTNQSICEYATSFHELYGPLIDETRDTLGSSGLGVALEEYVKRGTCFRWLQD
ncbi:hypothetical protein [Lentibacter sp. XHP0401]|jgi:hypothetical protein|uniref:hypothetical protein n=1 Tax=Lentibacter sp. XHP0401 TaxID=2984334 RepID=UPI0021E808B1|nr:hypothetical protein [Lentibacter sp. XHP0401]MCV2893434.1 hypothetical protein [Lentibacter sp. XHP0401]